MRVEVADGFAPRLWPVGGAGLYASQRWLRANLTRPGQPSFTIRAGDGDAAAAVLGYLHRDASASEAYNLSRMIQGEPLVFGWHATGADRLRVLAKEIELYPCVSAVLPGYDPGVVRTASASAGHLRAALSRLGDEARSRGARTLAVLYVCRHDEPLVAALREAGFAAVALTSRAVLPVAWDSLDGYLAHLPRSRRHHVRTELTRLARLGVGSAYADPVAEAATVVRLRCAHLRKFGREPDEAGERRRLAALLREFADQDLRLVLTGPDNRPTSCSLFLRSGDRVTLLLAANDPAGIRLAHFESAFYAPARLGLSQPGDVIDYGISHLEHKTLRGCVCQPLDAWVRADDDTTMASLHEIAELSRASSLEAPAEPATSSPRQLDVLVAAGIDFFTGVPDSELASLLAELLDAAGDTGTAQRFTYQPATREDNAVALAAGASLAGRTPLVFMKSMGLGTAVDALTSLARVYRLPMLLYVSWAGFSGRDVPHHNALGEVLSPVLHSLRIPHVRHTIGRSDELAGAVARALELARGGQRPVAVLAIPPTLAGESPDAP